MKDIDLLTKDIRTKVSQISKNESSEKDVTFYKTELQHLRDKEKQLRDKEKQLRDEKSKLLDIETLRLKTSRDTKFTGTTGYFSRIYFNSV